MPGLRENIDTNKNNRIDISSQCNEINNFILDKNKGEENLNELGKHLNNLDAYKLDNLGIKDAIQSYFGTQERTEVNKKIKDKVYKNEPLTNKELSLLYLEMVTNKSNKFTEQKLKFNSKQPIDQICGGALIGYIKTKYNFKTYTGKKVKIDLPNQQHTRKPSANPINRMNESQRIGGNINLPENIGEIKESEADFCCNKLITRAEKNFTNEIAKAKRNIESKHRYKDDNEKQAYIKYDTLLIAFEKYTEIVSKKHDAIINQSGYKNKEELENQLKLIETFEKEIKQKYHGMDKILSKIKEFGEEMKENEKKYFKNENETKKAEKNYKEFNEYVETKTKEYNIDEIQKSLNKDPKTKEEAESYLKNMNKIFAFQDDISQKNKSYGDSIVKYQKYVKGAINIQNKYNIQQYKDILEKYNQDISNWNNKINFKKYENYISLLQNDGKVTNGLTNINTLNNLIINGKSKSILVKEFKEVEHQQQIKQEGIDNFWNEIKNLSSPIYRTLTTFTGLWNGLVDATVGTFIGLMEFRAGLLHGKDEAYAMMDFKENAVNFLKKDESSSQKELVYDPETGFNFHVDNTVSTVASSISQMLVLIYGGGGFAKGSMKVFGIGEKIAGRVGLFSSSFIMQVGGSYEEAITNGLSGGEALGYSMLSATVQSGLELISPNEVLLGKGSGIFKELIKNACKSGSKQSFKMIGKTFLKNVGTEIFEENIQEGLQTVAGNLVNMATDGRFGSEIGADWSWKNFASTAVITTLTTGITTGASTGIQMSQLNSTDKNKLIEHIKSDNGMYSDVMKMINDGIAGTMKIPNVNIQQLQELKGILTSSTGTTDTGNLDGETINTEITPNNIDVVADDDVEIVAVDEQNETFKNPEEIRRIANIFNEFVDFNVNEYVEIFANIPLYGKNEEYIRNVLSFIKSNVKNNGNYDDFGFFRHTAYTIDYILSNSNITLENIKNIIQDERINIKDIEYIIKENNNISNEDEIKQEIKKNNILLNIENEEDLQKYITGKKVGSDITGNLEQYINENGLSENSEKIENWYYGNFNPETQKYTIVRDIGNSDYDIQLIQNIINQQNIKPRGLESSSSTYDLLKKLHNEDHEGFILYSKYLLGEDITSLAGEYSRGSVGGNNVDPALYRHTRIGDNNFFDGSKYRIVGEFYPGEIVRSGELDQVADQTANWPESERVTIGEVPNNNVKQIIDLETGKVIYDRDSGYVDPSLNNNGIESESKTDYFNGKSHQFDVTEAQARSNSENMDRILEEINEKNKSAKLEELRKTIIEQYKQATGEELQLTDEQILSILDAHKQDGKLGELTMGQLKQKVKVLKETINDSKIRRFLLEAGFCGMDFDFSTDIAIEDSIDMYNHDFENSYGQNNIDETWNTDNIQTTNSDIQIIDSDSDVQIIDSNSDVQIIDSNSDVQIIDSNSEVQIIETSNNIETRDGDIGKVNNIILNFMENFGDDLKDCMDDIVDNRNKIVVTKKIAEDIKKFYKFIGQVISKIDLNNITEKDKSELLDCLTYVKSKIHYIENTSNTFNLDLNFEINTLKETTEHLTKILKNNGNQEASINNDSGVQIDNNSEDIIIEAQAINDDSDITIVETQANIDDNVKIISPNNSSVKNMDYIPNQIYNIGEEVYVKRSSGNYSKAKIIDFDLNTKKYTVTREEKGINASKKVTADDLLKAA